MRLRTTRLVLRPHTLADAEKLNLWENDTDLRRLSDGQALTVPAETLKDTRAFLKKVISSPGPLTIRLAICTKRGLFIGFCMIAFIDRLNRSCKLGITIGDRTKWGKGYASEALHELIGHCFRELKMNRLGAEIYSFNTRSIALFKRAGFKREGILRQAVLIDGEFHDEHLYGLLRGDRQRRGHK